MITTLAIHNFRSIRELVLELHGFDLVTGANGSGKSNLYRALRLLADAGTGEVIGSLARQGGLSSVLWAGPEKISNGVRSGEFAVQGTVRQESVSLRLGFASDDFGYLMDLGLPLPSETAFGRDPIIKREQIFAGRTARGAAVLADRSEALVRSRVEDGGWSELSRSINPDESMLNELSDPLRSPELYRIRQMMRSWRFYDHFRTDSLAPARQPQVGTRTPVLSHTGDDLAAALQTVLEAGGGGRLADSIADAFPGSQLQIEVRDGLFQTTLRQAGMLRPLSAAELSDGTLRYLLLCAALHTPRPPELMVINEPETSLHPELLPALAKLLVDASARCQLLVVSHSPVLIKELERSGAGQGRVHRHELVKSLGETILEGQGLLDAPPWSWPVRGRMGR
ncbi:AAA family ATPase [Psychromicrobium lacuslunae]|uniref:ATP-binding protein n=1 Tax=Psychromicrobium lacuslunae TaxID=1618207 RepID=A0A0D4BWH2_9MICC|nr:AAA family ATPase [Psychromicrobium lacuslunae]AJT40475.1 ATP-binding protein [Psychromicrobium lacuslunae]